MLVLTDPPTEAAEYRYRHRDSNDVGRHGVHTLGRNGDSTLGSNPARIGDEGLDRIGNRIGRLGAGTGERSTDRNRRRKRGRDGLCRDNSRFIGQ